MLTAIENRIPPPIVMMVTGLAMWAFSWVTPAIPIPAGIRYGLVGVLLVLGVSVDGLALFSFRRAATGGPLRTATGATPVRAGEPGGQRA